MGITLNYLPISLKILMEVFSRYLGVFRFSELELNGGNFLEFIFSQGNLKNKMFQMTHLVTLVDFI